MDVYMSVYLPIYVYMFVNAYIYTFIVIVCVCRLIVSISVPARMSVPSVKCMYVGCVVHLSIIVGSARVHPGQVYTPLPPRVVCMLSCVRCRGHPSRQCDSCNGSIPSLHRNSVRVFIAAWKVPLYLALPI